MKPRRSTSGIGGAACFSPRLRPSGRCNVRENSPRNPRRLDHYNREAIEMNDIC
jgi:hypothetical protein